MSTIVDPAVAVAAANGAPSDWRAGLPDDLKASPSLEKFKTSADVAKSYLELEKRAGSAIKVPGADAPKEEVEKFYARIGRPESPDKYEFKRPENLPEGMVYQEEMEGKFKAQAHALGFTNRQAQGLLDWYNAAETEKFTAHKASQEAAMGELKKEWGHDYEKNLSSAQRAVKDLGDEKLVAFLNESGLGNHPQMVRLFAKLGADRKEDTFIEGDGGNNASGIEAIKEQIRVIRNDPKHPAMDVRAPHADRQTAIAHLLALEDKLLAAQRGA